MTGSSTPLTDQPDWHPVHRANAMLRAALLNSTFSPEHFSATEDADPISLFDDAIELARDPSARAYRASLVGAGQALTLDPDDDDDVLTLSQDEARGPSPQARVQALVHDFHRRQRQISLLVALCLAAAFALTLGGFLLIATLTASATPDGPAPVTPAKSPINEGDWAPRRSTSVAWQPPKIQQARVTSERVSLGAPKPAPTILASAGRKVALATFLPQGEARYLLLRGLPESATLSAGKKSASGAWMVKDEDLQDLTLRVGSARSGDYPVEVYLLQSAAGPQALRNFKLRIEAGPRIYTAGLDTSWTTALIDMAFFRGADEASANAPPPSTDRLLARAKQHLAEGDIAGAQLLLQHLAEQGQSEAAYELARTYDQGMLAALGASSMDGDAERARHWYTLASKTGSDKATERMKFLASLSGRTPFD